MRVTGQIKSIVRSPDLSASGWGIFKIAPDNRAPNDLGAPTALFVATGQFPDAASGSRVVLDGEIENSQSFGPQFKASRIRTAPPRNREQLAVTLSNLVASQAKSAAGAKLLAISPSRVNYMLQMLGTGDALRAIDHGDTVALAQYFDTPEQARALIDGWRSYRAAERIAAYCHDIGIPETLANRVNDYVQSLGSQKMEAYLASIGEDVFQLRHAIGPRYALFSAIADASGQSLQTQARLDVALSYVLEKAEASGHTMLDQNHLRECVIRLSAASTRQDGRVDHRAVDEAIDRNTRAGVTTVTQYKGKSFVQSTPTARAEQSLARHIVRLLSQTTSTRPDKALADLTRFDFTPTNDQRHAIKIALNHKVCVITGDPGTGKTATTKAILDCFPETATVLLLAPTGQAAQRMAESTGRPAMTIHNALRLTDDRDAKPGQPLIGDIVVVDETSMVDGRVAQRLFEAIPDNARVILLGDVKQLPSIGAGSVLRDIVSADIPMAHLSEVVRQQGDSGIIHAATMVLNGKSPFTNDWNASDCSIKPCESEADCAAVITQVVRSAVQHNINPDDIQVLVPTNKRPAGTIALNAAIRVIANPLARDRANRLPMRISKSDAYIGDRVRHTANDYSLGLMNGSIGRVVGFNSQNTRIKAEFEGKEYQLDAKQASHLLLDYATTIHRSQGSQYPITIVGIGAENPRMLDRQLIYTAFTRASKSLVCVTHPTTLASAVARSPHDARQTLLRTRLLDQIEQQAQLTGRKTLRTDEAAPSAFEFDEPAAPAENATAHHSQEL